LSGFYSNSILFFNVVNFCFLEAKIQKPNKLIYHLQK